jgi:hypothetical protein
MANPASPQNGTAQSLDYLIGDNGTAYLKRGAGDYTPSGAVNHSADTTVQLVALGSAGATALMRTPDTFKSLAAVDVSSETTIWTPTSGKKFRLMGFVITQGVATGDVTLNDNTGGTTILVIPATPTGQPLVVALGNGILSSTINHVLTATGVSTETLSGFVYGTEE